MCSARIIAACWVFVFLCFEFRFCRCEDTESPGALDATFLHVLVIADTDDPKTGEGAKANGENVCRRLDQEVPAHRCRISCLTGSDVSAEKIHSTVAELPIIPTDSVFCYYTGPMSHDSEGGSLALTHGPPLNRPDLLHGLEQRGARLTVFLTDGCIDYKPPPGMASSLAPGPVQSTRYLFFRHKGLVDIDSATQPQAAWGYSEFAGTTLGGIFTAEMLDLLLAVDDVFDTDDNGVVGWDEFSEALAGGTNGRFSMFSERHRLKQQRQDPKVFHLAQPVSTQPVRSEFKPGVEVVDAPNDGDGLIARVCDGSPAEWSDSEKER